jgi:hypothetical protein
MKNINLIVLMKNLIVISVMILSFDTIYAKEATMHPFVEIGNDKNFIKSENTIYKINKEFLENPNMLNQNIVLENSFVHDNNILSLKLEPFSIFDTDSKLLVVREGNVYELNPVQMQFYKGSVSELPNSFAYLAVFDDNAYGFVSITEKERDVLYELKIKEDNSENKYYSFAEVDNLLLNGNNFQCHIEEQPEYFLRAEELLTNYEQKKRKGEHSPNFLSNEIYKADIAVECDYRYFQMMNYDEDLAIKHAMSIYGAVSAIYQKQLDCFLNISYFKLWTSDDPYNGTGAGEIMDSFAAYWRENMSHVDRSVAQIVSSFNDGGMANGVGVLCNKQYGYSSALVNGVQMYPNDGSSFWNVFVVGHELGHLFGAVHTHNCFWNPPIDSCFAAEGGDCFSEISMKRGTLMSYCNFRGVLFHERVADYLKSYIQNSCLQTQTIINTPTLLSPTNNQTDIQKGQLFEWSVVSGIDAYIIQISQFSDFRLIFYEEELENSSVTINHLNSGQKFYWRVRTRKELQYSNWSGIKTFYTSGNNCVNNSLYIHEAGNYVEVPIDINYLDEITIEAWFNLQYNENFQWIVGDGPNYTNIGIVYDKRSWDMRYHFTTTKYGPGALGNGSHLITNNKWYHIAMVYDGKTVKCFINGELDLETPMTGLVRNSQMMSFGAGGNYELEYMDGYVDEIRIWDIARSEADINKTMYKSLHGNFENLIGYWKLDGITNNKIKDFSGNDNDGEIIGNIDFQSAYLGCDMYVIPSEVELISPENNIQINDNKIEFSWKKPEYIDNFKLQIATNYNFSNVLIDLEVENDSTISINELERCSRYYWRVAAVFEDEIGPWSDVSAFDVIQDIDIYVSGETHVCQGDTAVYTASSLIGDNTWTCVGGKILEETQETLIVVWNESPDGTISIEQTMNICEGNYSLNVSIIEKPEKPLISKEENQLISSAVKGNQWFKNRQILEGETSQYIDFEYDVTYNVIVTNENGCISEISDDFIVNSGEPAITGASDVCLFEEVNYSTVFIDDAEYNWQVTNGSIIGKNNLNEVSVLWELIGIGNISLIRTMDGNNKKEVSSDVNIHQLPDKPFISYNNDNILKSSAEYGNQWYLNGSKIEGATDAEYQIKEEGLYQVQVTDEYGCISEMSDEFFYTNIFESNETENFLLYPNPSKNEIVIELKEVNHDNITFIISDINGKVINIKSSYINFGQYKLDVSELNSGTYNIKLIIGSQVFSKKFSVAK